LGLHGGNGRNHKEYGGRSDGDVINLNEEKGNVFNHGKYALNFGGDKRKKS
jgi:hypothetical protein